MQNRVTSDYVNTYSMPIIYVVITFYEAAGFNLKLPSPVLGLSFIIVKSNFYYFHVWPFNNLA